MSTSLESSSDRQPNTPIFNLNLDVLRYIFLLNSDMYYSEGIGESYDSPKQCAYNTTLSSAQTCRTWRTLSLDSPSVWANVVDLDRLWCGNQMWREEFMKRTRNAPLSVKGRVDGHDSSFFAFFKFLLDNNWGRIRTFNVELQSDLSTLQFTSCSWGRADNLESFRYVNTASPKLRARGTGTDPVVATLFADDAPRLRHFHCQGVSFRFQAPWMAQLHSLSIPSPSGVSQILDVLAELPLLESLDLDCMRHEEPDPPTCPRHIQLSHLKKIRVYGKFEKSLAILRSIFPPPGCALSLTASGPSSEAIDDLHMILEKFWKSYSAFNTVTKFAVHFNYQSYHMTTIPAYHEEPPSFSIFLTFSPSIPLSYHPLFLGTLSSTKPMHLKELQLHQNRPNNIDPLDSTLVSFISSQQSLESLVVTDSSLVTVLKIASTQSTPLFPHLHYVKMSADDHRDPKSGVPQSLVDFLSSRIAANIPISVVDLTEQFSRVKSKNLRALDGMGGLKVLLKKSYSSRVSEYLCGHGLVGEE